MRIVILGGCGYIGSSLYQHLNSCSLQADTVDLEWFGNFVNVDNILVDFKHLDKSFYNKYDAVILLAGHSSVQMCQKNMAPVFRNNVANFIDLATKLDKQKFIYASSSSLYAGNEGLATEEESNYIPTNFYDLSKKDIDMYSALSDLNYYALRFGTVNGPSVNLRSDLMINKMYETALEKKEIVIYNEQVRRPILGISDLCRAITAILLGPDSPGIYNVASFNAKVGQIASDVAALVDVPVINAGTNPTYDFHISTNKFCDQFGFTFQNSTNSIVQSLKMQYSACVSTKRDIAKHYE